MARRKACSIKDIARESGASLTTVSLVLNGRNHRISDATCRRIREVVDRLGYRPSRLAQGLQSQRTQFLAIFVPAIQHVFADVYFGELISAAYDHATENDYKVLIEVARKSFLDKKQHLELFERDFVDGALCLGVTSCDTYPHELASEERPMVVVNNYIANSNLNHVLCDYSAAGRLAAEHLLKRGHRRFGLIRGANEVQTAVDLRTSFESAMCEAGLELPETSVEDGFYSEEGGAVAAVSLLKRHPNLTAIMAGNDRMAIGAISGLKSIGRRVPQDVSIIGCDNIHDGQFSDPPLTTVQTPLYEVGQLACRRLLELIGGGSRSVADLLPVELIERGTVASVT
jgi:DNA-binding LacI/PurR family transcriptional regulator